MNNYASQNHSESIFVYSPMWIEPYFYSVTGSRV